MIKPVTITLYFDRLDKILGQICTMYYYNIFDLVTGDYHFPCIDGHIVYVTRTLFTKHSMTLKLYNSRKLNIVYTKLTMFIKHSPTLIQWSQRMPRNQDIQISHSKPGIQSSFLHYNKTNSVCPSGMMP